MTKDGRPNVYALGTSTGTFEGTRSPGRQHLATVVVLWRLDHRPTKAVKSTDGRTQFFALDADGRLLARRQDSLDAPVSQWSPIGFSGLTGEVVALASGNDIEVLVHTSDGVVASSRYVNPQLTNVRYVTAAAGRITGRPAAVVKSDGKVQIFARRADGKIHTLRDTASGFETAWTAIDGVTAVGAPAAVISGGKIKLSVRSTDGFIYTNDQDSVDGAFTGWIKLTDSRSGNAWPSDTEPSMVALSTGKVVVMYRDADEVTYAFESAPATPAARSVAGASRYTGGPSPKPKS